MAGRGFAPKDPDKQAGHRTKAEQEQTVLPPVDGPLGPELPDSYDTVQESVSYEDGKRCVTSEAVTLDYLPLTREWYDDWRHSPQVSQFTRNTWRRLLMLAPLVDQYHRHPTKEVMAELRQNEAKLGATPEDMQRLHWKVPAKSDEPKAKQSAQGRRNLKVV